MPRLPRCCPGGVPQHIIQRGNNRQPCFKSPADYPVYLNYLDKAARLHCVDIHAWVLMGNHVHLLVTPIGSEGVSGMMQALGRDYVAYYNKRHQRTGTLWEGRFRSCLIDTEHYLLRCYRYIELNPVRAGMVTAAEHYRWSSYHTNAWGARSELIVPHAEYLALGKTVEQRTEAYRALFSSVLAEADVTEIRKAVNTGMALGTDAFKDTMTANMGRRLRPGSKGKPAKCPK
ncbi:MAG TPA: transposase [Candidatus Acidoferrum sp.]|nr:transposase [Candidatus Acidoferrum sp.]